MTRRDVGAVLLSVEDVWLSFGGVKAIPGVSFDVHEHEIRSELEPLFEILELREFRFDTNQSGFRPLAWAILARRK